MELNNHAENILVTIHLVSDLTFIILFPFVIMGLSSSTLSSPIWEHETIGFHVRHNYLCYWGKADID